MTHQPMNEFYFVEVEEDSMLPVLYYIRDVKSDEFNVILESDFEIFERYYPINAPIVIIRKLISEAPLIQFNNIYTASLEKILVDLFLDVKLFEAYQGKEMEIIFNEAISKYVINQNRMIRYANRRGKKETLFKYLENQNIGSNR